MPTRALRGLTGSRSRLTERPVPELPDVAGFCRLFAAHMVGEPVTSVLVRNAIVVRGRAIETFVRCLEGKRFKNPVRHGKWLLAETEGPTLLLHFGMTGRLRWEARESHARRFDRVEFHLNNGKLVFQDPRNLGSLWLADNRDEVRQIVGDLGPDALTVTAADMQERFASSRTLKALLMDQSVLAGLGNMLSDEVLWKARIHPARRFKGLDPNQVEELADSLRAVLRRSVKAGRIPRQAAWLASQRSRANPRCPRCGAGLRKSRIAGRSSYWCPICQVPPAGRAGSEASHH
jgi:formamidopyrimidine-DNA glycosylase